MLGSSFPGVRTLADTKGARAPECRPWGESHVTALARPIKSTFPNLWETCGRREREAGAAKRKRSDPRRLFPPSAVEGTRVFGMAASFAGRRWKEGLDRPCREQRSPPRLEQAPMTAGVRRKKEEGNVVGTRPKRCSSAPRNRAASRTRPSLGPSTRATVWSSLGNQRRTSPRRYRGRANRVSGGTGTGVACR
jgi:hypothetical protein